MQITMGKIRGKKSWFAFQCGKVVAWRKSKQKLVSFLNDDDEVLLTEKGVKYVENTIG